MYGARLDLFQNWKSESDDFVIGLEYQIGKILLRNKKKPHLNNSKRPPFFAVSQIRPMPPACIDAQMITLKIATNMSNDWNTSVTTTAFIPPMVE